MAYQNRTNEELYRIIYRIDDKLEGTPSPQRTRYLYKQTGLIENELRRRGLIKTRKDGV